MLFTGVIRMKKNSVNEIENISLSAKQIKNKIQDAFAYDHSKYKDNDILFDTKPNAYYKLPFSDYKIAISEELANQQLLLENIHHYLNEFKLIEESPEEELYEEIEEEEVKEAETNNINILEEICEFDEIEEEEEEEEFEEEEFEEEDDDDESAKSPYDNRAKRPRYTYIKIVDVDAVIAKIKREAIEKNKDKPVIGRRQINKMLKPYMIKKSSNLNIDGIDDSLTSIDIYLNAVNKIANINESPLHENSNVELNLKDILNDLEK